MPQHDMILDNASGAAFRGDANAALAALASTMKGPNAPPAPMAGMQWVDDDTPSASVWTWKVYDGADWLAVGVFDITANAFLLRAGAGSAAAPSYSFSGDTDTGLYTSGANSLDFTANGERIFNLTGGAGSSFALIENAVGGIYSTLYMRTKDSSASVLRGAFIGTVNENFVPVASIIKNVHVDGSSSIELAATPAGSRASDRRALRVTVPGSGPVVVNSGGLDVNNDLRFNSGYGSAALAFGVRAWVNFNGTGTVAIRGSGGVTSITDNGVGDYTVNFNFTMPDANYAYSHAYTNEANVEHAVGYLESMTTSSLRVRHYNPENSAQVADKSYVCISVVR
jgi:hypothetical protein